MLKRLFNFLNNFLHHISYEEKIFEEYKSKERFIEQIVNFKNYKLHIPDAVSFAYQVKDIFIDNIYKYISTSQSPLIYDCGANIGLSILYFKQLYPDSIIKAFEADKKIYNYLQRNIENNKISGVELFNNAVWINDDILMFNSEGADGGSLMNDNSFGKQNVKGIRLKNFIDNEKDIIDFLKIDIEGAEVDVLIDCSNSLKKIRNICIEYHSFINEKQKLDDILRVLTINGFRYHIETISHKNQPFINKSIWNNMDLQLEIFGWRNEL